MPARLSRSRFRRTRSSPNKCSKSGAATLPLHPVAQNRINLTAETSKLGPVGNAFSASLRGSVVSSKKPGSSLPNEVRRCACSKILLALIFAAGVLLPASALAGNDVDLLLILAADVSRSIDAAKFQLQRDGYAHRHFRPARSHDTIKSEPFRPPSIALTFVESGGRASVPQHVLIDWTAIGDGLRAPRISAIVCSKRQKALIRRYRTSISTSAIELPPMDQRFTHTPFTATRRIIDIASGDSTNNAGHRDVSSARDDAVVEGVTINGLVILSGNPMSWGIPITPIRQAALDNYYRNNVVGGPGAFVMVAKDFNSFGQAMIGKLIAEVAENRLPKETRLAAH